ncbi:MAG: hypothetical protein M3R51_09865 [Candidatus Eremiobacteraeota bacterium]|nr:hypothetical protein [Candidatus Eremiobacteraeota bacterium]
MLVRLERGAAMAETAAVLGFILSLLFGTSQIVLAGYYQLQLDMATFLYSHSFSLTNAVPTSKLTGVLPIVPLGKVSTSATAAPDTETGAGYGSQVLSEYTSGGVPSGPVSANTERYGGASIIRPQQIVSSGSLTLPSFDLSIFNNPVQMTSGDVEARSMVSNHDMDATGFGYNTANSTNNFVFPTGANGDDQNVVPYYFTMSYMRQCPTTGNGYFDCTATPHLLGLGLAEYLKDVSQPSATNGNYTIGNNGIASGEAFYAMTCHQRFFAQVASVVANQDSTYAAAVADASAQLQKLATVQATQYDLDTYGKSVSSSDEGTQYPQTPMAVCP